MSKLRDDFTYRLLVDSGIAKGMRVLDIGCGSGDVSLLAAELVGSSGEVLGFDISEAALELARANASHKQIENVEFIKANINNLPPHLGKFDAIIGRRVLMYLPSPKNSIKNLIPFLAKNGIFVFQESDSMGCLVNADSLPLHTQVQSWIWDTVSKEGGDIHMGLNLYAACKQAGLEIVDIRAEASLHTPETGSDLAMVTELMLERITGQQVAALDEIDIDSLSQRLEQERQDNNAVFLRDIAFWVCAKLPG